MAAQFNCDKRCRRSLDDRWHGNQFLACRFRAVIRLSRRTRKVARSAKTFIAINCAAIPENLLEANCSAMKKGAFTARPPSASQIRAMQHGTIFLDEIGDMFARPQTKILRVLQSGVFERVGGNQTVQVDVRVIAATNKPLEQAVANREFREDLFYRLNVVRIQIPPLRDRRQDIRLLVNYFLKSSRRRARSLLPPRR